MKCNLLPNIVKRKCLHTIPNPLWVNPSIMKSGPGLGIKIKVLNSVLILTFADQIKWFLCRFFSKLYLLLLTSICLKYVKTKLKNCMILKSSPAFWDFYVLLSHNIKLVIFTQAHKWYRIILHSLSININFNETSFTKVFINITRWKRSFGFTDHGYSRLFTSSLELIDILHLSNRELFVWKWTLIQTCKSKDFHAHVRSKVKV